MLKNIFRANIERSHSRGLILVRNKPENTRFTCFLLSARIERIIFMRISFLWDMTQDQCGVTLDILPHEVEATQLEISGSDFSGTKCRISEHSNPNLNRSEKRGVTLDILSHEVEATKTRNIWIRFLRDQVPYLRTQ